MNRSLQMYIPSQYSITVSHPYYNGAMEGSAKRKWNEVETTGNYNEQRLSVMNTSIIKLKNQPSKRTEPSLRRSLLIFNTLKHIENEIGASGSTVRHSGISQKLFVDDQERAESIPSRPTGHLSGEAAMEVDRRSCDHIGKMLNNDGTGERNLDEEVTLMESEKIDIPPVTSVDISSAAVAHSETSESRVISSNEQPTYKLCTDQVVDEHSCNTAIGNHNRTETETSYFNLDDLFPMFDYSYDLDFFTSTFSTDVHDQLSYPRSSGPQTTEQKTCSHRNELLLDDFDHIMEVLVGN